MTSRLSSAAVLITVILFASPAAHASDVPKGFTALFNGKDLSGWHGMDFDPYKLDAMKPEERAERIAKWTEDAKQHWKVEKGELVNDGKGAFLTTDREFGDIELLVDFKIAPKTDSGVYLRATPQVQIWDHTKEGGQWNLGADKGSEGCGTTVPARPARIRWSWPTSRLASGTRSGLSRSASGRRCI
jgi:hypothetical protein